MFKIILRAILQIVLFVITIPLRVLFMLYVVTLMTVYKIQGAFTFKESWTIFADSCKKTIKKELHFIKTGEIILEV